MPFRKATPLVAGTAGLALLLAGCGSTGTTASGSGSGNSPEYVIGADIPLSGPNQIYGQLYQKAINLAVANVNASHLLHGQLKVDYVDGQALPAPSVAGMEQLVNVDHVLAVLTGFSAPTKAIAPIANRDHVVEINGGASSPDLARLGPYMLNDIPLADEQVQVMIPWLVQRGLNRWAVIYSNETLGTSIFNAIQQALPAAGGQLEASYPVEPTAVDYQSEVAKIKALSPAPNVVFLATTSGGLNPIIIKQLRQGGVNAQIVSYAGFDIPATVALPQAQGSIWPDQYIDYHYNDPATQTFNQTWSKQNAKPPITLQTNYYNAVLIIADALKYMEDHHEAATGSNLLAAIHSVKRFPVVGGTLTFQSNGTVVEPLAIKQLENHQEHILVVKTATPQ
ncbi:MAG: ABC transporter substrate-binding protein [Actinomycetia bacterium]|nr:ABC transporter substrate-binding protein [Actinomycetes bacterium]